MKYLCYIGKNKYSYFLCSTRMRNIALSIMNIEHWYWNQIFLRDLQYGSYIQICIPKRTSHIRDLIKIPRYLCRSSAALLPFFCFTCMSDNIAVLIKFYTQISRYFMFCSFLLHHVILLFPRKRRKGCLLSLIFKLFHNWLASARGFTRAPVG